MQVPGNLEAVLRARIVASDESDARGRVGPRRPPVAAAVLRVQTEVQTEMTDTINHRLRDSASDGADECITNFTVKFISFSLIEH